MAEQDVGRVRAIFKGQYDATLSYEILDRVKDNGKLWEAKKNVPSGVTLEEGEYWDLLSEVGMTEEEANLLYPRIEETATKEELELKFNPTMQPDIQVKVPTDYATLSEALFGEYEKYHMRLNKESIEQIEIVIESGFVIREQVVIKNKNMGWIKVSSEDAEVQVDSTSINGYTISGENSNFPIINILMNMNAGTEDTTKNGISIGEESKLIIEAGKGFINAGGIALFASFNSYVSCSSAKFNGAKNRGIFAYGARIYGTNVEVDDAGIYALLLYYGTTAILPSVKMNNAGTYGALVQHCSALKANGGEAKNVGNIGVYAGYNSKIDFDNGVTTDTPNGIYVVRGSQINAYGTTGTTNVTVNSVNAAGIIYK